jgi:2-polyprenyl-3-methyl-5-hydroxy-6-metoxy-1,4-benzoquinol methylase
MTVTLLDGGATVTDTTSSREGYWLGYRQAEQERLGQQAEQLAHEAVRLFDEIGVPESARILEIGCGPRGCLDLLAERVGPTGRVVGIEVSEEAVDFARAFVAERGLSNVEVMCGDARATGLDRESFDVVTSRLVLVNVPHPEEIVREAVALARPGGAVAFHEIDFVAVLCDPPSRAFTALVDLFVTFTRSNGNDLYIGRRLHRLLREAGLVDVRTHPIVHAHPPGDPRRPILLQFIENVRERVVAQDLITESELDDLKAEATRHLDDPETLVYIGPYVQVWGRKPV